jgi:hypothetical protein
VNPFFAACSAGSCSDTSLRNQHLRFPSVASAHVIDAPPPAVTADDEARNHAVARFCTAYHVLIRGGTMNRRTAVIAVATALVSVLTVSAPIASAQGTPQGGAITIPLVDTATTDVVLTVTRFVQSGGQLLAVGTVTATVVDAVTGVVSSATRQVRIPVLLDQTTGTCEILSLVLGPLNLDLLGLQVRLNQVVLDIEAEPGPGNLLGNLLCAVAGLLDQGGPLSGLANLLNQILGALA